MSILKIHIQTHGLKESQVKQTLETVNNSVITDELNQNYTVVLLFSNDSGREELSCLDKSKKIMTLYLPLFGIERTLAEEIFEKRVNEVSEQLGTEYTVIGMQSGESLYKLDTMENGKDLYQFGIPVHGLARVQAQQRVYQRMKATSEKLGDNCTLLTLPFTDHQTEASVITI